jgi:hypothetical protein
MEKVIHVHLYPARRPAPVRAKTRDCGCQHEKDAAAKAAQDALDQENARELSGLEKHEWNKLSPAKRAEWIQKFAKHKGRTDSKRSKDAAFGEGDEVFINPRYGGGTGRVVEASPSGHFFVVRTRKGSMSFHESDISEDPFPGQREEDAAPKRGKDAAFKSPQEALQNVEAAIRGVRSNLRGAPPVYLSDFMQYANQAKSLYKKGDMSGGEAAMLNASKAYQAGIKESRNRDAFTPQQENESRRWRELERQIKNAKAQGKPDLAGRLRKEQQGLERTMTKPESLEMSASR